MDMISAVPITVVFVAIFALLQVPITVAVGLYRAKTRIQFMDDGDPSLMRRMRAHANFTETVPMNLLAMAAAELAGAPGPLLWTLGGILLVGRSMHYATLVTSGHGIGRSVGMLMTVTPLVIFPAYILLTVAGIRF